MRLQRRVTVEEAGRRLGELLGVWLPETVGAPVAKSAVRRLVMAGAVRVDGRPRRRPGFVLEAGARVEATVDPARLQPPRDRPFRLTRESVLFEDEWLLVVDKPSGLATVATADPSRPHIVGAVQEYLGASYVGVHQRLDRETSGVVLFTKDPAVNPALARAFAGREVLKTYHALTVRPSPLPPPAWRCDDPVDGAAAATEFHRLEVFAPALLVEARPRTGRKHQIRVHLASAGMPILGDDRYGGRTRTPAVPRLMLHAAGLRVRHPKTGEDLHIESPRPPDFEQVLADLRARG